MFCKVYQPFCIPLFVSGIKNPGNILYVYFAKCISLNVIFHIHQLYNFASSFFKFVKNKVHGISIKMTDTQVDAFKRGDSYINFFLESSFNELTQACHSPINSCLSKVPCLSSAQRKFCFIYIIIRHVCFIRAKSTSRGALNEKGPQLYVSLSSVGRSQAMSSDWSVPARCTNKSPVQSTAYR